LQRSYKEYKDILPAYKQAEAYRADALEKTEQIKKLQDQLAGAAKTNGVDGVNDAAYWKDKYDNLLSNI
jgi:hypothetical protein